jgi:hypothetical protein
LPLGGRAGVIGGGVLEVYYYCPECGYLGIPSLEKAVEYKIPSKLEPFSKLASSPVGR